MENSSPLRSQVEIHDEVSLTKTEDRVLALKLWYLTSFSALACILPFLVLFFQEAGLSTSEIGMLIFLRPVISIPMSTIWNFFVDMIQQPKTILILTTALSTVFRFLIGESSSYFWLMLTSLCFCYAFAAPGGALTDSLTLRSLSDKSDFGKVRLWGAVGWGVFSPIAGFLIKLMGIHVIFPLHLLLMTSCIAVGFFLPSSKRETRDSISSTPSERREDLVNLLKYPKVLAFFLIVVVMGMAMGCMDSFVFLYLKDLGGSSFLMGLTITAMCFAEIPAMYLSGYAVRNIGVFGVLCIVLVCYILRLLFYSFLTIPWLVMPIELLHGITFGWGFSVGTMHAGEIAPRGLENTTQGIFGSAYSSVGFGLGSFISGFLYANFGAVNMFRIMATFVSLALLVFIAFENSSRNPVYSNQDPPSIKEPFLNNYVESEDGP